MPRHLALTQPTDLLRLLRRSVGRESDHPAVPNLDHLVYAAADECEWPILIPVDRQDLRPGRRDRERRGRDGVREAVCCRGIGRRAQVENLHRTIC